MGNPTLSPNCADSTRLVTFWQPLKLQSAKILFLI